MQENFTQEQLVAIITNSDKRYLSSGKDYVLIIKDEPHRPCSIYISDCEEAIWSKVIDLAFFANLKRQLQLASPLKVFAAHFVKSLQNSSYIEKDRSALKIFIQLEIGEGLMMSSSIRVQTRIHYNNPDEFKKALRKFTTFLWDVKNAQLKKQKQKEQLQKLEKERKEAEQEEEHRKLKAGYGKKAVTGKNYMIKKGDLMNPQRKKRKKLGAKLGTGYQQDMFLSTATPTNSTFSIQ